MQQQIQQIKQKVSIKINEWSERLQNYLDDQVELYGLEEELQGWTDQELEAMRSSLRKRRR
jgi:hypothetical protein